MTKEERIKVLNEFLKEVKSIESKMEQYKKKITKNLFEEMSEQVDLIKDECKSGIKIMQEEGFDEKEDFDEKTFKEGVKEVKDALKEMNQILNDYSKRTQRKVSRIIYSILGLTFFIVTVANIVKCCNAEESVGTPNYIIAGVSFLFAVIFWVLEGNITSNFCNRCEASMRGCDYEYDIVKRYTTGSDSKTGNYTSMKDKVEFKVKLECPECGKIKTITLNFVEFDYNKNVQYDVGQKINDYIEKKYGEKD